MKDYINYKNYIKFFILFLSLSLSVSLSLYIYTLHYILQFTDSARFMASSFSNLVNNLFQGVDRIKYKFGMIKKMLDFWN